MPAQIVRERSKLTTSGVRTLNIYWTVRSRRTVLEIKIVKRNLKKKIQETLRRTQMNLREGWRCSCDSTEIQGKMKQVARTLTSRKNNSKPSQSSNLVLVRWRCCCWKRLHLRTSQQKGPSRTRLSAWAKWSRRRQPKEGHSVVIVPSFYLLRGVGDDNTKLATRFAHTGPNRDE